MITPEKSFWTKSMSRPSIPRFQCEGFILRGSALSAPRSIVRADGKILWTFDPHVRLDSSAGSSSVARVNRGVAVWAGKICVGTGLQPPDAHRDWYAVVWAAYTQDHNSIER